jgi:hypothetical protein
MEAMEGLCKCLFFAYKVDLAEEYTSIGAALVLNISDNGRHDLKDLSVWVQTALAVGSTTANPDRSWMI